MSHRILIVILVACGLMFVGCSDQEESQLASSGQAIVKLQNSADVEIVEGVIGPGSLYALYRPESWNGDLVIYAHGYVFPFGDVTLPEVDELRDGLLEMGYGVAYSSYPDNGFAVKEGATATRKLRGLYASNFGKPENTFITGHSMGGLISVLLAERNPNHYTGAMPMCGIIGGSQMAIGHIAHVRILFDYFYPGALPGDALNVPADLDPFAAAFGLAVNAMVANPLPAFELAAITQTDLQYNSPDELIEAIAICIFFNVGAIGELLDRTHEHNYFDNTDVYYTGSTDDAALNAAVDRFSSTPDAENYLEHWYQPRGVLRLPVLTLHTTRDPVAPVSNQAVFGQLVDDAGDSDMLRQYQIDRFGHCAFTTEEMLAAFQELVDWSTAKVEFTEMTLD